MASLESRLSRARSVAGRDRIDVSDLERELDTVYTVDTVRHLTMKLPHLKFVWVMGADNLAQVSEWQHWPFLFESLPIAIFDRSTYAHKALLSHASRFFARSRRSARAADRLVYSAPPAWVFVQAGLHSESGTSLRCRGKWVC